MTIKRAIVFACLTVCLGAGAAAQTPPVVPKPFPQPGQAGTPAQPPATKPGTPPPAASQPAGSQPAPLPTGLPSAAVLNGAQVYPGAEFLESHDASRGQRAYLYGTNATFLEIVNYYRQVRKDGGRELFKAPAMQQWDLGEFREQTMAMQPAIVVKDYTWNGDPGYLFVDGTKEKRFKTIIQIVPASVR